VPEASIGTDPGGRNRRLAVARQAEKPWRRAQVMGRTTVKTLTALTTSLGLGLCCCPPLWACSSCGCSLNSDWASQGYTTQGGLNLDARYDYFDQTQLRQGTHAVSQDDFRLPAAQEVQQNTLNRNLTMGLDYSPTRAWGVNLQLPYEDRPHTTVAAGDAAISGSHSTGLGDVRVLARYQGFQPDLTVGVQFGVKLPTGRIGDTFRSGPQAGQPIDRGLQLGTGTTDVLLGVYTAGALNAPFAYFASALLQQPLNSRDDFKPGAGLNLTLGLRYTGTLTRAFTPQLQLNVRAERRESGANADVPNSGATLAYLIPGVGLRVGPRLDAFAFVQVPVYQRVNGLQLEAKLLGSMGIRYRF
jgi:hypothetical protein